MLENYGLHYLNHWNICGYMESRLMDIWRDGDIVTIRVKGEGFLYGKDAILVYESFEKIIESVLQKTRAVMVLLDMKDVLSIKIELDRVKSTRNLLEIQKKFEKCNGTFETFSEEDTLYIRGTLPILGGGVS